MRGCHLRETKLRSWPQYNVSLQAEAVLHQARRGEATQSNSATTRFSNASDVTGVKHGFNVQVLGLRFKVCDLRDTLVVLGMTHIGLRRHP